MRSIVISYRIAVLQLYAIVMYCIEVHRSLVVSMTT
jgi:hypothetical protein